MPSAAEGNGPPEPQMMFAVPEESSSNDGAGNGRGTSFEPWSGG